MSSNTPTSDPSLTQQSAKSKSKNILIAALSVLVVALAGYLAYDKSNSTKVMSQQETKIETITAEKSELQSNFDASLARLDSMATVTSGLEGQLNERNSEIASAKEEIRKILNKKNATEKELSHARKLISDLNGKISSMEAEVAQLKQDNQQLTDANTTLTAEKQQLTTDLATTTSQKEALAQKVDIASTLNANNIIITPYKIKGNGKEKISSNAKKVDKLVVSFDVANRIIQSGRTDLYVIVVGPDGEVAASKTPGATFTTRDGAEKKYTAIVPIELETGKTKNVSFTFSPSTNFHTGAYKIMIYQNGFLIGQGTRDLKKGGLFS